MRTSDDGRPKGCAGGMSPWALLAVFALWACEDGLPTPTGPGEQVIAAAKGGKRGSPVEVDVTTSGAVTNPGSARFEIAKENSDVIDLGATFQAALAFSVSRLAALADLDGTDGSPPGLDHCFVSVGKNTSVPEARLRAALQHLVDPQQERMGGLGIGKAGLLSPGDATTSTEHRIGITWPESEGLFSLTVGRTLNKKGSGDPTTVTLVAGNLGGDSRVLFSGGSVAIHDRNRPGFAVFCPNLDLVDATIERPQ